MGSLRFVFFCVSACASIAATLLPLSASAVTLDGLKREGLGKIYGSYAPGGDCKRQPLLVIDDPGFTFTVAGRTVTQSRIEYAVSYMGPDYEGISLVFFPFPKSEDDLGPVLMMVNHEEHPGVVRFESNLAPGQKLQEMQSALIASRLLRCAGTARTIAPVPAQVREPVVPATPAKWTNLAGLLGRYLGPTGASSVDLLVNGSIAATIKAQVNGRFDALVNNLTVSSPLQRQGSIYYLSGNAPHRGGEEQAYILIDAARRAVQIGLWEKGKLMVYAPKGSRIPLPADIAALLSRSPGEDAVALPGTPWELVPTESQGPIAYVEAAGSISYRAFSVFCQSGRPMLAALLTKSTSGESHTVTWNFAGRLVDVVVSRGNKEGTYWQGSLAASPLISMLAKASGSAMLRFDGQLEGEALMKGSGQALRTALNKCVRI